MAKQNIGTTNRNKGNGAERLYANIFKELGFDKCVTSRYGSRQHDDAAIDLINIPINVQIKAGKQTGLKPIQVIGDMISRIKEKFPANYPEHNYPNIVIHRKDVGRGKKRTSLDDIVTITFDDFSKLLKMIKWD